MKHPVRLERQNGIAVIAIENPPVNALSAAVRRGILGALHACLADDKITAIVLAANGRSFPAGADIAEFGLPEQEPNLPDLCDIVEASPKPVLAALHGTTLGGGLELAMAAHYRVAHEDTQLGLPEITLGLLPGAGGTQRAPRLIGVDAALDLMLTGKPISARKAQQIGLVDGLAGEELRDAVKLLAAETTEVKPTRSLRHQLADGARYMARIAARRAALGEGFAAQKIVECVEAALLVPFDVGLSMEREAFGECLTSDVSHGLRHAFFAERRARKFPEIGSHSARMVEKFGVVGGGTMGSGIVIACLNAGLPVTLVEQGEHGVNAALDRIGDHYKRSVAKGTLTQGQGTAALNYLNLTTDLSTLRDADVIIEALPDDLAQKQAMFAQLGALAKPGAVLASNTSYLDVAQLAEASGRAADVLAMHFFAPAHHMKAVEIGVTPQTAPEAVATAHAVAVALKKIPVRCSATPALIGNRMLRAYRRVADRLLLSGATPAEIDAAMREFGMAMGPFEAQDLSGLDIAWARRKADPTWPRAQELELADRMCEAGWLGQKTGRGYYVYGDGGAQAVPNGDMLRLLSEERAAKSVSPHPYLTQDLQDRLLCALINEGAHLLEEGIASNASDIDVVMMHGLGFPRQKGGPMNYADRRSLFEIHRLTSQFAAEDPEVWQVSKLLAQRAGERQTFGQG
ncbi:MAG: 3-hydroxyacyl-CoA dehydrogenase NAD-binding domain-containing protein [Pseudomonadota bacterium]